MVCICICYLLQKQIAHFANTIEVGLLKIEHGKRAYFCNFYHLLSTNNYVTKYVFFNFITIYNFAILSYWQFEIEDISIVWRRAGMGWSWGDSRNTSFIRSCIDKLKNIYIYILLESRRSKFWRQLFTIYKMFSSVYSWSCLFPILLLLLGIEFLEPLIWIMEDLVIL